MGCPTAEQETQEKQFGEETNISKVKGLEHLWGTIRSKLPEIDHPISRPIYEETLKALVESKSENDPVGKHVILITGSRILGAHCILESEELPAIFLSRSGHLIILFQSGQWNTVSVGETMKVLNCRTYREFYDMVRDAVLGYLRDAHHTATSRANRLDDARTFVASHYFGEKPPKKPRP